MSENWNCDGSGPHRGDEVRVYPLGGGANLILCRACWNRENAYNRQRAEETGSPENFTLKSWGTAEVYGGAP